jgi:hypothetical protein
VSGLVGSQKCVKDFVGEDGRFVIEMVVVLFCVSVETFYGVEVCSLVLYSQYLHGVLEGAKGVLVFY